MQQIYFTYNLMFVGEEWVVESCVVESPLFCAAAAVQWASELMESKNRMKIVIRLFVLLFGWIWDWFSSRRWNAKFNIRHYNRNNIEWKLTRSSREHQCLFLLCRRLISFSFCCWRRMRIIRRRIIRIIRRSGWMNWNWAYSTDFLRIEVRLSNTMEPN